ncbi:uncharacterized protein TNCV_1321001 [Trichonephila clavipes]|nr:uncharacterized protein TNCV_1321001 [Trichonephila clavipes]
MLPIEHGWDLVGRHLARDPCPAASKDKLLLRIQAIWNSLPQADIQNLFDSMPPRQRYQANGLHCETIAILSCPKPIPQVIPVLRPKYNTIVVRFTRVNNQGERNNVQGNAQLCRSRSINGDRFNSCQVIYSQFGLAIHQNDHQARRRFVEWAQNEIAVVPDFHKRILFSDEAHFWLNGKQNCRIWSEADPQVYVETPLRPEKLTVWCALWAGGILLQKR